MQDLKPWLFLTLFELNGYYNTGFKEEEGRIHNFSYVTLPNRTLSTLIINELWKSLFVF